MVGAGEVITTMQALADGAGSVDINVPRKVVARYNKVGVLTTGKVACWTGTHTQWLTRFTWHHHGAYTHPADWKLKTKHDAQSFAGQNHDPASRWRAWRKWLTDTPLWKATPAADRAIIHALYLRIIGVGNFPWDEWPEWLLGPPMAGQTMVSLADLARHAGHKHKDATEATAKHALQPYINAGVISMSKLGDDPDQWLIQWNDWHLYDVKRDERGSCETLNGVHPNPCNGTSQRTSEGMSEGTSDWIGERASEGTKIYTSSYTADTSPNTITDTSTDTKEGSSPPASGGPPLGTLGVDQATAGCCCHERVEDAAVDRPQHELEAEDFEQPKPSQGSTSQRRMHRVKPVSVELVTPVIQPRTGRERDWVMPTPDGATAPLPPEPHPQAVEQAQPFNPFGLPLQQQATDRKLIPSRLPMGFHL